MNRLGSVDFDKFLATAMSVPSIVAPAPSSSPVAVSSASQSSSSSSSSSSTVVIIVSTVVVVGVIVLAAVVVAVMYKRGCVPSWSWLSSSSSSVNNSSYTDVIGSSVAPPWSSPAALEDGPGPGPADSDRSFPDRQQTGFGVAAAVFEAIPPAPPQAEDADIPDDPTIDMDGDQFDEDRDSGGLHYAPSAVVTWKEFKGFMV